MADQQPNAERPPTNTVEGAVAEMGRLTGYESPELAKGLEIEGDKLITALDNLRKNNPDAADKITEACFAKVADLRARLAEQPDQKQVIDNTRGKLAELGAILKNATPPLIEKPDLKERVLASLTETARERDLKTLINAIRAVDVEITASEAPRAAQIEGTHTISVGVSASNKAPRAVAEAPTTSLSNITTYAKAETRGVKGAMNENGQ